MYFCLGLNLFHVRFYAILAGGLCLLMACALPIIHELGIQLQISDEQHKSSQQPKVHPNSHPKWAPKPFGLSTVRILASPPLELFPIKCGYRTAENQCKRCGGEYVGESFCGAPTRQLELCPYQCGYKAAKDQCHRCAGKCVEEKDGTWCQ